MDVIEQVALPVHHIRVHITVIIHRSVEEKRPRRSVYIHKNIVRQIVLSNRVLQKPCGYSLSIQEIFDFYGINEPVEVATFQNHVQFSRRTLEEELMYYSQLIYRQVTRLSFISFRMDTHLYPLPSH